jgi:hypothetical protein
MRRKKPIPDATRKNVEALREYLAAIPAGPVRDTAEVELLLAACWHDLEGCRDAGMEGYKLAGRMEDVTWDPPILSFTVERHGGTVLGSSRATLQDWAVDLGKGTARCAEVRSRQVRPMQRRLDVSPLADGVARLIVAGQEDDRLTWNKDGSVRVRVGKILPEGSAVKQTLAGRRKRFRAALGERLAGEGWMEARANVYQRLRPPTKTNGQRRKNAPACKARPGRGHGEG